MKVLMINVCCGTGSTGRICTDLATSLEQQGHDVRIAYGRDQVPPQFRKYAVRIGTDSEVKLHAFYARFFDASGLGSRIGTIRFIDWVKEYDPDVIHLHNIHGYYINIEILFEYLRTCGKRIIWTLHDCWAFTGHTAYCDVVKCERWIDGCHNCPAIRNYPKSYLDFSASNWKKKNKLMNGIPNLTIVTPSEWLAGLVRKSYLAQYPVQVIHNGVDTSQFYPMENHVRESLNIGDKLLLLGVSTSWNEMKGYSDYLKLANMLGDNYQIVLVGLTNKQKDKLPKNVIGIEKTNSVKELAQLYSAADLFLNLSYCENYPTVNLEAIACGTPVLTYRTGGSPESAGKEAIVIERGELEKVLDTVRKFERKAPNVSRELIDSANTVREYSQIIENVL